MAFDIISAVEGDAAEVADVHIKAMNDNALLHAQFPNAESLAFLRTWLVADTIQHVRDGKKGVLVAKGERFASFVKWEVRGGKTSETDQTAHTEDWPSCCRAEYLDPYADLTAKVRKEVMGDSSYYRKFQIRDMVAGPSLRPWSPTLACLTWPVDVTYLCTTPSYAGQGAASALLRRVQELAAADSMAVVLESTMNAVSFYQKLGFAIKKGLDMVLPKRGSNEPTELYEEKCMVWRPDGSETRQG